MAEQVLAATRAFAVENSGGTLSERRIFRVSYAHEGRNYTAEVGKPDPRVNEHVIVILEAPERDLYLVCTANRGVVRGMPVMVGASSVLDVLEFDAG
jgi:hypothetical protein